VEGSSPSEAKEGTAVSVRDGVVEAPATLGSTVPKIIKEKKS
jgi:hypothetical protein